MARHSIKTVLGLTGLALCLEAQATPGAVDQYDCHRNYQTDKYHCHGSEQNAKQSHSLFGVSSRNDIWLYDNGPLNLFSGGAGEMEFGFNHVALHAGYGYQVHITGDTNYTLTGWDIGVKVGPNISRLGLHPYADIGYFNQSYQILNNPAIRFGGWQYGGGLIWNRNAIAFDLRLLNKTTGNLERIWDNLNGSGLTTHLSMQLGGYLRF